LLEGWFRRSVFNPHEFFPTMLEKGFTINCLDHGFVRYIDHMGDDLRIIEAARISYKSPSKGEEQDKKLLFFLYKNAHSSPFEQCNITFNIKMPIMVMREFVRHRTFRLNEMSGRYVQLPSEFYIPSKWRAQDQKNKQGSVEQGDWNPKTDFVVDTYQTKDLNATDLVNHITGECYNAYEALLKAGVARELARMVLPVNIYTEIYVNCDVRNLMHFFNLRLAPTAQWEIRQFAGAMFQIFEQLYPWSAEAWRKFKFRMLEEPENV
jgi:thymidylate synthase (FAD)